MEGRKEKSPMAAPLATELLDSLFAILYYHIGWYEQKMKYCEIT